MLQTSKNTPFKSPARQAFAHYLRTGQRLHESAFMAAAAQAEVKFNPYHDPRDGRFTFAPGGVSTRAGASKHPETRPLRQAFSERRAATIQPPQTAVLPTVRFAGFDDGVFRPQRTTSAFLRPAQFEAESRPRARSNYDPFIRPMTLERVFPDWAGAAAGAIINPVDDFFQITGPVRELTAELTKSRTNQLIAQIMKIDPKYRFDTLGFPQTTQGMINQLNGLQRVRAATLYRMRGELRPFQVEALKFLQDSADKAYEDGIPLLRAGKLNQRLSPNEALGNYIDGQTRKDFRTFTQWMRIPTGRGEPVQINRRHYDTRENDRTYRIPDARIGNVAFDVTLTRKTLATRQVRGFFNSDAEPNMVVIIRPRQLGQDHTYAIKAPGRR